MLMHLVCKLIDVLNKVQYRHISSVSVSVSVTAEAVITVSEL